MSRLPTGEPVLARAARIVEAFGVGERTLTVSEIARRAELPTSTASRLIEVLVGLGWLDRDGRQVRIGIRLWEVASRSPQASGLCQAARPFMEELHALVGQHTQLAIRDGTEVLFLERLSARGAAVDHPRIAGRLPLSVTSSGLVLLAHSPAELQEKILAAPMRSCADKSMSSPQQLRSALAGVRRQGYALMAGQIYPETAGIAVPIRGRDQSVVAALSVIVPNDPRAYYRIPALQTAARGISRRIAATDLTGQ